MSNVKLFLLFGAFYGILILIMVALVGITHPKPDEDTQNFCWELAVKREHAFAGTQYEQAVADFNQHCLNDISKTSPLGGQ